MGLDPVPRWYQNATSTSLKFIYVHGMSPNNAFERLLQVTTHQIAILVLFNTSDSVTVKEIAAETEIETDNDYLQKVISVLLKTKVLLVQNRQLVNDDLVTIDDELVCNDKYKRYDWFSWLFSDCGF